MLEGSISVETFRPPLGNGRVELLLPQCLPLEQHSTTAHIARVGHQDNLPLCPRHAQALSAGYLVFELVKRLLLLWAPAPSSTLLDQVRQNGAGVGEVFDVAAKEICTPQ